MNELHLLRLIANHVAWEWGNEDDVPYPETGFGKDEAGADFDQGSPAYHLTLLEEYLTKPSSRTPGHTDGNTAS